MTARFLEPAARSPILNDMRRHWTRILSLVVALALVANGVPAAAELLYLGTVQKQTAMAGSVSAMSADTAQARDDCCNDCAPVAAKSAACFAACVHLPALVAIATILSPPSAPVFDPVPLMMAHGRPIAPDPFPPRPLA